MPKESAKRDERGCLLRVAEDEKRVGFFFNSVILLFKKRFYTFIFRERGRKGEKEGEKYRCVRDSVASCMPQLGTWPANQAYVLTRNRTIDISVLRVVLNPLSHTSQGKSRYFLKSFF